MRSSEEFVQRTIHALEVGELAVWIKRSLLALVILAIAGIYLYEFRGLATSQAMDQAQIGRFIASGHGWRTNLIRPRAIGQLAAHHKNVAEKIWFDTYQAPLPPLVDAIALFPIKSHKMSLDHTIYVGDRVIAGMSIALFLSSVVVLFFLGRRLFDRRVALLSCGLVLLCDMMWQYSLSGLPQMLLLLLFNLTIYAMVRAVEEQYLGGFVGFWLAGAGLGFGLLALTHAITLWIFAAAVIFCLMFFRPRWRAAGILGAGLAILYLPWLLRTFLVCGNPAGVAIYSALDGITMSEAAWMRHINVTFEGIGPGAFRDKALTNLLMQSGHIVQYFGYSVVAVMFFAGFLHRFKRTEVGASRWMLLLLWAGAVLGMAVFGINEEQDVAANQLHLVFMPLMTCYGLAFLLVQWRRLGIELRLARVAFIALLYFLCAAPMIRFLFFSPSRMLVRWPPYMPPVISVLNDWMQPQEITASDMPWAIAWYANRRSIWLPETIKTFTDLNDYDVLKARINAIYLTPISGTGNTYRDIVKGEYQDWSSVIQRTLDLEKFPLKWATLALGLDNECSFFSDHDRAKSDSH
jgi:hypothetical protein